MKLEEVMASGKVLGLTENSLQVLTSRYLKKDANGDFLETPQDMFRRVAKAVANGGPDEEVFYGLMVKGIFLPNSPTLMNAGKKNGLLSACFVLPLEDSIDGIFDTVKLTAQIQKAGGGTGYTLDRLRPTGDWIKTSDSTTSGPIPFWGVLNETLNAIQQGAKRRGACMMMMSIEHPDILKFIYAKQDKSKFQNFNMSVKIPDKWMEKYKENPNQPLVVINPRTKKQYVIPKKVEIAKYIISDLIPAETHLDPIGSQQQVWTLLDVWEVIVSNAWQTGEPGVIFIDRMNKSNPTPNIGLIEATNPCLAGNMYLLTATGYKTMRELWLEGGQQEYDGKPTIEKHGELKIVNDKGTASATNVYRTSKSAEVYRITLENGVEINATSNHEFIIRNNSRKKLTELKVGDELPINQQRAFGKFHYPEYAELAGWVIGDGTITLEREKQQAYVICYCDEINTVAPRLRKDLLVVYKRNNKSSNQSPTFEGRREIQRGFNFEKRVMHSNVLGRLMKEDGLVPRNKHHVPKSIWQGDKETIAAFIRGFFSADGSVQLTNSISIRNKQVNTSILYECQLLLNQFNIVSQFLFRKNAGKKLMNDGKGGMKLYNSRAEYELAITGRINVEKFINEIGFIQESQNNKAKRWLEIHKGSNNSVPKDYLKVKEVALLEPQETFCLTEPQTHEIVIQTMKIGNCGEQPLLPYEACNLGSINIDKFVEDNKINLEKLKPVIHIAIRFLNGVIDVNHYVIPEIEKICVGNRKIGLGIMGFADALFKLNIGYNTQEAINLAKQIMKFVNDEAQNESERLAEKFDVFNNWKGSRWDTEWKRKQRNAACTTIAPTGTISIIANCSGGIEPLFSLAFQRNILDGKKLIEVNTEFKKVAKANKYWGYIEEELFGMIIEKGSLRHISNIPETIKKIFVCAHDIAPEWHIKMQAAFQEHCASSISKTINFPNKATLEDTYKIYQMAYDLKCKGITIYRDDCRDNQPMSLKNIVVKEAEEIWSARAPRRPTELEGFVHLIKPNGKTYAIFVGKLKNHVFEVFALDHKLAMLADGMTGKIVKEKGKDKGGKEINFYNFESGAVLVRKLNGYEDNELSLLTRIISTALRHGTPIEFIIDQICKAKVPINHVGKAIAKALSNHIDKEFANGKFKCWECGSTNITWQGSCRTCIECGRSSCSG